jgi:septal ring factor EnvC (AmiA/AmiB activator)
MRAATRNYSAGRVSGAIISICALVGSILLPAGARATEFQDLTNQLNSQNQKAAEVSSQISNTDAQLATVQAQVADTQAQIASTNAAIEDAKARMAAHQDSLNELVRHEYQRYRESDLEVLVQSKSISEFVDRDEYLKAGQNKVAEAVDAILDIKKELDAKAADLNVLGAKLADQQNALMFTRGQQQNQMAAVEAARANLTQKLAQYGGQVVTVGQWVNAGDLIGFEGTSGCSTGPHLHFEVQAGGGPVNPRNYAPGVLRWPLDGGYSIAQEFGRPNWAAPYSFHSGMDMAGYFGEPVHAAGAGTVIFAGYDRSGFGDHVIIDHGGGLHTIYGHMGPRPSDYPAC